MEMEINLHDADYKTKMATILVYGEIPSKIYVHATSGTILMKLCM